MVVLVTQRKVAIGRIPEFRASQNMNANFHLLKTRSIRKDIRPVLYLTMAIALLCLSQRPRVVRFIVAGSLTLGIVSQFCIQDAMAFTQGYAKAFGSNPSFISLTLGSSELLNHDTKRLRFKLPERDAVSGLPLTCEPASIK